MTRMISRVADDADEVYVTHPNPHSTDSDLLSSEQLRAYLTTATDQQVSFSDAHPPLE